MKGNAFYLTTLLTILFITSPNIKSANQVIDNFGVQLTAIRYDNQNIPRNEWDGLKINRGVAITFEFNLKMQYKKN